MDNGKNICKQLKEIRKEIARENNIPLESRECTYSGPCNGTCPYCDAELRYLEEELSHRSHIGKAAMVAGMTVGMVTAAQNLSAQNNNEVDFLEGDVLAEERIVSSAVTGFVISMDDGRVLDGAEVTMMREGDTAAAAIAVTNEKGIFTATVPYGQYLLIIRRVGYIPKTEKVTINKRRMELTPIALPLEQEMRLMGIVPFTPGEPQKEEE